ncbi:MAG: hypothetical protein AABX73_03545 [Nanoarchaeota archaeon]
MIKKRGNLAKQVGIVLLIVVVATLIDWGVHSSRPEFFVDFEYYRNKIIFATLWGLVALWIASKYRIESTNKRALIFAGLISVVLQTKYFLQGYDLFFVFLFMFLHFFMFLIPALIAFNKYKKIFA